jgi:glycosyltransferase involved in cell wall biosynthesis
VGWCQSTPSAADGVAATRDPGSVDVSVIIPCRNEDKPLWTPEIKDPSGKLVQAAMMYHSNALQMTLDSVAEPSVGFGTTEAIVVDDASDQPLRFTAPAGLPVRVIRNPIPLGVDPSRNIGIAAARGRAVAILDCHNQIRHQVSREPIMGGLQTLAREVEQRRGLVVGRCGHIELLHRGDDTPMTGGSFVQIPPRLEDLKPEKYFFGLGWGCIEPSNQICRVPAILGADYVALRETWLQLDGFVQDCRLWGASEEGVSLKAAFLGLPIWYVGSVTVLHWFRHTGPHPFVVDSYHKWLNYIKVVKVTFDDTTFANWWLPRFQRMATWRPEYLRELESPTLLAEMQRFRVRKVRSDANVMRQLFGVTL